MGNLAKTQELPEHQFISLQQRELYKREDPAEPQKIWTKEFITICVVNLFIFLGFQMLLPVLPIYAAKLGGSSTWAGLALGAFTLSAVIIRPFVGRLIDRKGRKVIYYYGIVILIVIMVSYQWMPSVLLLLAVRFIHGFGWGAATTATSTIASDLIPKRKFAEGMGYFTLTTTLPMALGPAIGAIVLGAYGFSAVFIVASAIITISLLLALPVKVREPEPNPAAEQGGVIEKSAILPSLVMFFITLSYGAIMALIALYAQERHVENIGLFFTIYSLAILLSRPYFGRLADRKGEACAAIPGILCILGAMGLLYFAYSLSVFLIAAFIYGVGFGAVQPSLQAIAVRNVTPDRRGTAKAVLT